MLQTDRRVASASSLRQMFQTQWTHICALIDGYSERRQAAESNYQQDMQAVETLVSGTSSRLRLVNRYRERLRSATRGLLEHVAGIVNQLPPAFEISAGGFATDPRIGVLFVNPQHFRQTVSECAEAQEFFSAAENAAVDRAYAVLFTNRVEREVLGSAEQHGRIVADARKHMVSFSNHLLHQIRPNETELTEAFARYLYDGMVEHVNFRIARAQQAAVQNQAQPKAAADAESGPNLKDPAVYLRELMAILEQPAELLKLEHGSVRLDRMGERLDRNSPREGFDFPLWELHMGRRTSYVVNQVSFARRELQSRDDLLAQAERLLQL